jgi:hypothetical protein
MNMKLTDHKIAEIFPLMTPQELQELADNIKAQGLRTDIILYEGKILDGRNRYRACILAGVQPTTCHYAGDDPIGEVMSLNLHRRQLTVSQRTIVAAKWAQLKHGEMGNGRKVESPIGESTHSTATATRDEAAKVLGVGTSSIDRAKRVIEEAPELVEKIERGEMTVNAAYEATRKPEPEKPISPEEPATKEEKIKIVIDQGFRIWGMAKMTLDTIAKDDASRVGALNEAIKYCNDRIKNKK